MNLQIEIDFQIRQKQWHRFKKLIQKTIKTFFQYKNFLPETVQNMQIGVLLLDDFKMKQINWRHRNKKKATNVLSFPYLDFKNGIYEGEDILLPDLYLGDILLAPNVIKKQAFTDDILIINHWRHLIVHSVLHLFGFDHEIDEDFTLMKQLEGKIQEFILTK